MALIPCEECGRPISDRANACPQCGVPTGRGGTPFPYFGYEWRSPTEVLGWPLIHVAGGWDPVRGTRRVARGVIAVGDIAVGALAVGGIAIGGLALGGLSVGLAALGGVGLGVLIGFGGFATGYVALGGVAVGVYAMGGVALGIHTLGALAQDPAALELFERLFGGRLGPFRGGPR